MTKNLHEFGLNESFRKSAVIIVTLYCEVVVYDLERDSQTIAGGAAFEKADSLIMLIIIIIFNKDY